MQSNLKILAELAVYGEDSNGVFTDALYEAGYPWLSRAVIVSLSRHTLVKANILFCERLSLGENLRALEKDASKCHQPWVVQSVFEADDMADALIRVCYETNVKFMDHFGDKPVPIGFV